MDTRILNETDSTTVEQAAEVIRAGGLVAFPTETVYGLGANALDPDAAGKIYEAKGRPGNNPLIVHLAIAEDAEKYCYTNETFYRLAERFMPGPLTLILPKRDNIPYTVTGGLDTVAIRIPAHPTANSLIRCSGVPIAAPSANLSGKPSPTMAKHVVRDLYGRVDVIIEGGDCDIGVESTIVTLAGECPRLLRPGLVTVEQLREICPDIEISDAVLHEHNGNPESPGMMYIHYSPEAQVTILHGTQEKRIAFLRDKADCGILCYDEDTELLGMPYALSLGSVTSRTQQAKNLFARLREFDEIKNVTKIYAPMPDGTGVGLAVLNRLIRAAGFSVLELEKE